MYVRTSNLKPFKSKGFITYLPKMKHTQGLAASNPELFLGGAERKFSFHFVYWLLWPQLRLNTLKDCRDRMGVTTQHSEVLGISDGEFRPRSLGLFPSTKWGKWASGTRLECMRNNYIFSFTIKRRIVLIPASGRNTPEHARFRRRGSLYFAHSSICSEN